ncbi:MAG: hypothetical protein WBB23_23410 [Desulforhopalus sp.]
MILLKRTKRLLRICIASLALAAIFLFPAAMFAAPLPEEAPQPQAHVQNSLEKGDETDMAMLSHELEQWENAASVSLAEDVPGPGAFIGALLKIFSTASTESDARIKNLVAGIPHVFVDLNKVLVAL